MGMSFPKAIRPGRLTAATGAMPLDSPESVLVRFNGWRQPGSIIGDQVHAIPLFAHKADRLTLENSSVMHVSSGRILGSAAGEDCRSQKPSNSPTHRRAIGCRGDRSTGICVP